MDMIKRKILDALREHLRAKEITVIVGPRQVGKTTLMRILQDELSRAGNQTLFFNLDYGPDTAYFESQEKLVNKIRLEFGDQKGYVFIDEIQRKENAGLFLKGIYDIDLPYKFIVSGSGSLELKEKIQESLTGRKRLFEILPVTFEEFVHYRTDYRYEKKFADFISIEKEKLEFLLNEYLSIGGYPRIITETKVDEKRYLIDEIFRSYVEKDIVYLLKIDRPDVFVDLIKLLATQVGQIINYSQLATHLGISVQTVKKYIWYAQKTFIINLVTPFFRNYKKEITKSPVVYFCDVGLRNHAIGRFGNYETIQNDGFLFQNFVFNLLREKTKKPGKTIHFWRTSDKAEVDFVIEQPKILLPIEVKFMHLRQKMIKRSLRAFIEKYQPQKALVVNLSLDDNLQVGNTQVVFLPYYKLLLDNIDI